MKFKNYSNLKIFPLNYPTDLVPYKWIIWLKESKNSQEEINFIRRDEIEDENRKVYIPLLKLFPPETSIFYIPVTLNYTFTQFPKRSIPSNPFESLQVLNKFHLRPPKYFDILSFQRFFPGKIKYNIKLPNTR